MAQAISRSNRCELTFQAMGWGFMPLPFACPRCQATVGQWRGYRTMKDNIVIHRRRCNTCGRWFYKTLGQARPLAATDQEKEELRAEKLRYDSWREAYEYAQEETA